ncbi:MAG: hypothetical protein JNJ44_08060 [Zoogloeaceae bacterium]|nr:hypothetical protein [Zoogloeaceae bacterium]
MADLLTVFLVTADDAFLDRHRRRLSETFNCRFCATAGAFHAALSTERPDFIVLDMGLSDGAALPLHRALREDFDTSDLFQLLLCEAADLALDGIEPDDQLLKPFDDALFWRKLDQIGKVLAGAASTRQQLAYAQGVALTALSTMGELGVVMEFLSKSFACQNIQAVTALAADALRQYDLVGAVCVFWDDELLVTTTDGAALDATAQGLLDQRDVLGRIHEDGSDFIVNFARASLVVTNMPMEDGERRGRIRDNMATLAEGVQSRIDGLLLVQQNLLRQQAIRYAIWEIRDSLQQLEDRQMADLTLSHGLVSQVIDDFEDAFLHLGLSANAESHLINLLVDLRQRVDDIMRRPGAAQDRLQTVIAALESLAGKVDAGSAPQS